MRTNTRWNAGYPIWTVALFALPFLMGAKGNGCVAGGDLIVGVDVGSDAGPSCSRVDCEGKPLREIGRVCPSGQTSTTECAVASDGTCDWTSICVPDDNGGVASSPIRCEPDECANEAASKEALLCADGTSVGRTVCMKTAATSACHWDFPPCPPLPDEECAPEACAGKGVPAIGCVDATPKDLCVKSPNGSCNWKVTCIKDDAGAACTPADCLGQPVPTIACAIGRTESVCKRRDDGQCRVELECPDQPTSECTAKDCEGEAIPDIQCGADSVFNGTACSRGSDGTCHLTISCTHYDWASECTADDCAGKSVPNVACADAGQNTGTVCTRKADGSCDWKVVCAQ